MNNKEKAPIGAVTPTRAKVEGGTQDNSNIPNSACQIVDYLSTGRSSARTARKLADCIDSTPRDVTRLIERARLHGAPICATCNAERPGYYLARDAGELSDYLQRFKRRRRTIARTEAALITTLCAMTGQVRMDFKGGDV